MLTKRTVEDLLAAALTSGGDFAEVFVEDKPTTTIKLVGGRVEESVSGRDFGVGIRIFSGLQSVYAYTNAHAPEELTALARKAAQAVNGQAQHSVVLSNLQEPSAQLHGIRLFPGDVAHKRKVEIMRQAYSAVRSHSAEVSQATVLFRDEDQHVLIANSAGTYVQDRRVRTRLMVEAVASQGSDLQTGYFGPGAHAGFELFEHIDAAAVGKEAARIAVAMLHAQPCPSGRMPVIIDNAFGGVIFHEACGHGLEATAVAKGQSVFAGRLGEKIAPEIVTYIDDGTLANEWGSQMLDDEGEPIRRNVLIENGVLTGYLIDKLNGRRMGMPATGSARRQSYKFTPTSRMTNTYIAPGKSTPEEIIANTEYALYCAKMGGGQVNTATGAYNFSVDEGYIVRNGKICEPVRGATLVGTGLDTLQRVDMVGNNLAHGQGMCGSISGSIPVNVGQPMLRVSELTVGGKGR